MSGTQQGTPIQKTTHIEVRRSCCNPGGISEPSGPIVEARKLEHGLGGLVLGSLILYLKGMRIMMHCYRGQS